MAEEPKQSCCERHHSPYNFVHVFTQHIVASVTSNIIVVHVYSVI